MSDHCSTITALEQAIEAERTALFEADAEQVLQLSARKEELVAQLVHEGPPKDDPERFKQVVSDLRENLLLLVYARGCVQDSIAAHAAAHHRTYHPRVAPALRIEGRVDTTV